MDLKGLNIMRSATGTHAIRLIDLDAAAAISKALAGAKFSSGQLPPEMIAKLTYEEVQQLEAYWAEEKAANSELWNKIKPKVCLHTPAYFLLLAYSSFLLSLSL